VAPATYTTVEIFGIITSPNNLASVYMRPTPLDSSGGGGYIKAYTFGTLWDGVHGKCLAQGLTNVVSCDVIIPMNALVRLAPHYYSLADDGVMYWATASGSLAGSIAITSESTTITSHIGGPYSDNGIQVPMVVEFISPG
jgi:hypothetical protein